MAKGDDSGIGTGAGVGVGIGGGGVESDRAGSRTEKVESYEVRFEGISLPPLTGVSQKQIDYGNDMRRKVIDAVAEDVARESERRVSRIAKTRKTLDDGYVIRPNGQKVNLSEKGKESRKRALAREIEVAKIHQKQVDTIAKWIGKMTSAQDWIRMSKVTTLKALDFERKMRE